MSYVHQVYVSDGNTPPSPTLSSYMERVKAHHDNFEYRFYTDSDVRSLLGLKFKEEVLWAYETLVPYSYKVDLAKYCLLWEYGGWYYDVGVYPEFSIHFGDDVNGVFFTDSLDTSNGTWRIVASVMYSTPKREAFMEAIERIIQNCKDEYYGEDALHPTSTALLGKIMPKEYFENKAIILGEGKMMAQPNNVLRKALVLDGEIFSWYKDKGGDLGSLGAKGTNNYNYFWGNKCAYSKK
jgi:Glycosyltransferase sugar-binding region containing DXD motif